MSKALTITISDWVYDKIEMLRNGKNRSEFVEKCLIHSKFFQKNDQNQEKKEKNQQKSGENGNTNNQPE